jgi:hypothetical protein
MALATLVTAAAIVTQVGACTGPPRASYDVIAAHGPVTTSTDLSLRQITDLAGRGGRIGKHAPLGFYVGTFGYLVSVHLDARNETDCTLPMQVAVRLMLVNRRIGIGKELLQQPCLFDLARAHYGRHAAADDAALTELLVALKPVLNRVALPELQGSAAFAEQDRKRVEISVRMAIEGLLEPFDAARSPDRVDTPAEIEALSEERCHRA